ncbi:MAG: adenine deaminase [Clostridia bacterium]|nr:adenine deaminase [Clostridia bacterium]
MNAGKNDVLSEKLISAAREHELPDLVLKNGNILSVFTGEIIRADVAVSNGYIVGIGNYNGRVEKVIAGKYVVPGFINAHLHVESSMVTPQVYAMEELKQGTTTIITDPHEIANVGGIGAIADILKAARESVINYYVMLPSCVPATPFEHSGSEMDADDLSMLKNDPNVLGLGEMMNVVGVIEKDPQVLKKLCSFNDMVIDGHAPGISGKELNAYVCAGIGTDHESTTYEEAVEKLRCGLAVLVREGSASKNLEDIISGVVKNGTDTTRLAFCTDDKHLADIRREGTIRYNIEKSIKLGLPAVRAYQMATINAARIYGLRSIGAIACGYKADMVVLDDLESVSVCDVYKDGVNVKDIPESVPTAYTRGIKESVRPPRSVNIAPLGDDAFVIPQQKEYSVIGLVKNQILTRHLRMTHEEVMSGIKDGSVRKIAVIERHHATGCMACAYITGYGLKHGAVGTTVAHDSHNVIVLGDNDSDMLKAVSELERINGGYTIVADGEVKGDLPLEHGGLMSMKTADEFIPELDKVIRLAYEMGVDKDIDPFITLSFTALPVIPQLRITDCGLFDVDKFAFVR